MKRYYKTFMFVDNECQAKDMCERLVATSNDYVKTHKRPYYTPWTSSNGEEKKFVVWYHYKR